LQHIHIFTDCHCTENWQNKAFVFSSRLFFAYLWSHIKTTCHFDADSVLYLITLRCCGQCCLMFRRYMLASVSRSIHVWLVNFFVYSVYAHDLKRWGGGWEKSGGWCIIWSKRYSESGKLCNQHFQGIHSAAENNWQLIFPTSHQSKCSSPPLQQRFETQLPICTHKYTHLMYIDHEDAGTSTWYNNPRTKFTSTNNRCQSSKSVISHFLIQCFQLMGCGFHVCSTFENKCKKKSYSFSFFAIFIMLCFIFCEIWTNILKETVDILIKYPI
jgi:hypothetical protein